jgi:excisionase family DNA binding protein
MAVPRTTRSDPSWLSLDEAAKRLNVHPATLRDWADKGRIRAMRTPGGHRRFSEADVKELGAHQKPDLSLLMHATVGQARIATRGGRLASESWYASFDDASKARQRELGMDLVQQLVSFLADPERDWNKEIQELGRRYAELAQGAGLSVGDAMRAFHLFEGLVRSSVEELGAARVPTSEIEQHVGWFLNEVQVAMVESLSREG